MKDLHLTPLYLRLQDQAWLPAILAKVLPWRKSPVSRRLMICRSVPLPEPVFSGKAHLAQFVSTLRNRFASLTLMTESHSNLLPVRGSNHVYI